MTLAVPLTDRIARLSRSFRELKERVRDAVAAEMGKVVADAVRDWITAALHGRVPTPLRAHDRDYAPPRDADGWDDDDRWAGEAPDPEAPERDVPGEPKVPAWAAALSLGFVAAKWLLVRRMPLVPSLGAGVLLGTAALVGGPLVQASIAAASAAADLVAITRAEARPPN